MIYVRWFLMGLTRAAPDAPEAKPQSPAQTSETFDAPVESDFRALGTATGIYRFIGERR